MNENKCKRKYDTKFRKNIITSINKIKSKEVYLKIFSAVRSDIGQTFSQNTNGVFFNINLLNDATIEKINNIVVQELDNIQSSECDKSLACASYSYDNNAPNDNLGPRLSNQEKSILKTFRFTK